MPYFNQFQNFRQDNTYKRSDDDAAEWQNVVYEMIIATGTNTIHKTATSVALNYGNFLTDDLFQFISTFTLSIISLNSARIGARISQ